MKPEKREELKAAALAATPGPWSWWTSNSTLRLTGADGKDGGVLHGTAHRGYGDISCSAQNMAFIERANPAAILSLIAQVEALTVPPGYRIVPIEPTPEMFEAAGESLWGYTREEANEWAKLDKFESQADRGVAAYAAMLDAAPTIPATPGTKEGA